MGNISAPWGTQNPQTGISNPTSGISNPTTADISAVYGVAPGTPVLSLISATTNALFAIDVDNTIGAGDTVRLQIQTTGGNWSSLVSDTIHVITSGEDAANEVDLSLGLASGSYDARALVIKASTGLSSAWSNTVTNFTISASTYTPTYYILGF